MKYCKNYPKPDCGKCENCKRNERNRIKSNERQNLRRKKERENKS